MKYSVVHYFDVWGNPDDGFEVNDVCRLGDVDLEVLDSDSDDEFLDKVLKALSRWFDAGKLRDAGFSHDARVGDEFVMEFVLRHEDGCDEPFCRLEKAQ